MCSWTQIGFTYWYNQTGCIIFFIYFLIYCFLQKKRKADPTKNLGNQQLLVQTGRLIRLGRPEYLFALSRPAICCLSLGYRFTVSLVVPLRATFLLHPQTIHLPRALSHSSVLFGDPEQAGSLFCQSRICNSSFIPIKDYFKKYRSKPHPKIKISSPTPHSFTSITCGNLVINPMAIAKSPLAWTTLLR